MAEIATDFHKEADFILDYWDYAIELYDHEGWCDFIAWSANKRRAISMTAGDELVALGFFWQLDDPNVDWSDHFPRESCIGQYLYCPFAVIKESHRNKGVLRQMIKTAVETVDSPFLKYLSYNKLNRRERLKTMKLEDLING